MGIFSQLNFRIRMPRALALLLALLLALQLTPFFAAAEANHDAEQTAETEQSVEAETAPDETFPETEAAEEAPTEPEEPAEPDAEEEPQQPERFFPDYTLDDYAGVMYGTGTIKNNGCSVCCMAVVATYLTGHQYYPDELAKWFGGKAENNTDRVRYMAQALQLPMTEAENYDYVKQALREGKIVIQLMNSRSLFTNSQHFILLKGFNENGKIEVYDPSTYNRQSWRRKLVYILPKGQQCNETMYAVIQSGDKKLLEGFTPEEEAQFREYLLRALHNVSPDFDIEKVKKEEPRK